MPQPVGNPPPFRPGKDLEVLVDSFNGGLNTLLVPTEIGNNELSQADNLMLVGKGIPTGRWGNMYYSQAGASGAVRMLSSYVNVQSNVNQLLAITDAGYLAKKTNASYTLISGASFLPNLSYQATQLGNYVYIAAATLPFVRYDGTNLTPYIALVTPSLASLAIISAVSGTAIYSWRVSALSNTGETLGSPARNLASLPLDLTTTSIQLAWNPISVASGQLVGYNIYRGTPGNERLLTNVGSSITSYIDQGAATSDIVFPPLADTTAGVKGKYIIKWDDRTVISGVAGDPSIVYISAPHPYQDQFNAFDGGAYIYVQPDDGDIITGIGIAANQGNSTGGAVLPSSALLVFKKNSVHRVGVTTVTLTNADGSALTLLSPVAQALTYSNGCSSGDTVVPVENDTFYFGRKGLFTIGQEPTFLNQIRTNELTSRIRPYVQNLSDADLNAANGAYINYKYILSFPTIKETIIYDRERLAFMGPWKTPFGITKWLSYIDSSGVENWLAGADDGGIYQFSDSLLTDNGTAFSRVLRTKRFDFGAWSVMKIVKLFYLLFRNVRGQVSVNILLETKSGNTVAAKSFTFTSALGTGGWGSDEWGTAPYGDTDATIVLSGDELARWGQLYKQARVLQVEVISNASNSDFELLGLRFTAQPLGDQSLSSSLRV